MARSSDESSAIRAAEGSDEKGEYVRAIFSEIAPRYDLLNHLLSFNVDRAWRKKAIAQLGVESNETARYLDVCAGTLDVSRAIAETNGFRGGVIAADFAEPMLRGGLKKIRGHRVSAIVADALALPLPPESVDGAIVAFGIRNVADLGAALGELHRVLQPGARIVILEFSTPRSRVINAGYQLYFNRVLPAIGGLISGHRSAYRYLPLSVANFPTEKSLAERMTAVGFQSVTWTSLSFGIAAIHTGEKARG